MTSGERFDETTTSAVSFCTLPYQGERPYCPVTLSRPVPRRAPRDIQYIQQLWEYPSLCRVCCSLQLLRDSQGLRGGLAGEWLCLLPMLGYRAREIAAGNLNAHRQTKAEKILALFVNLTSRVLHADSLFSPCISNLVSLTITSR